MARVVLALGSNLGDPDAHLSAGLERIAAEIGEIVAQSSRRVTKPLLHPERPTPGQPDYLNGAVIPVDGGLVL